MSLYIDMKYLAQISHRIPKYTRKGDYLVNCRCVYCGDSQTNPNKKRGYFYRQKNDLYYKCHNCSKSIHFGTYLKDLDSDLYKEYVFERYSSGYNGSKAHKDPDFNFVEPVFDVPEPELKSIATRLDALEKDHDAVAYVLGRGIPESKLRELYYLEHTKDICQIAPEKYADVITSEAPRIAIPFYNEKGELVGVTMRAIYGEALRYIHVTLKEHEPQIFGLKTVDKTKDIIVVEGAFDSMLLSNAIAINGAAANSIQTLDLPHERLIIAMDNEPRNKDIVNITERYIEAGYRVCVWPNNIEQKDINDMANAGVVAEDVILKNAHKGLRAKIEFSRWKRV
jgi:hypothetical protein